MNNVYEKLAKLLSEKATENAATSIETGKHKYLYPEDVYQSMSVLMKSFGASILIVGVNGEVKFFKSDKPAKHTNCKKSGCRPDS